MGGEWQTKFNVSPGPGLWPFVLGPFGPDLGPDLDLTWDLDLGPELDNWAPEKKQICDVFICSVEL